jgi:nucleoid-associated protein YgaU
MRYSIRNLFSAVAAFAVVLVLGCGDPVPLREMAEAHLEITKATSVKAEKYAPKELKEAGDLLIKSHDQVKNEKYDDAQKTAADSIKKAKEAYDIALPLLAKDAIDAADKTIAEADELYASELANADFDNAQNKLKASRADYDAKKFMDAYNGALEAEKMAQNAKQLALAKKDSLKDAIAEVNETVKRAEAYNAAAASPVKLAAAKEKSAAAQGSYDTLKIKEGYASVTEAKKNADEAYFESIKAAASANIVKAENAIADADKQPNAKAASDEINGAKEMLKTSRSQFDQSQYKESIQSSDEAVRLAAIGLSVAVKTPMEEPKKDEPKKEEPKLNDVKPEQAKTEEPAVVEPEYDTYVVQLFKGKAKDCLWFIAGKFYNSPIKWPHIYKANTDRIKNPNFIKPGWELKIPKKESLPVETPKVKSGKRK